MLSMVSQMVRPLGSFIVIATTVGLFLWAQWEYGFTEWEYGSIESFVLPPGMEANDARLHLFMSVEGSDQQRWEGSRWHIRDVACSANGIEVYVQRDEQSTVTDIWLMHFSLMYPEAVAARAVGPGDYLDNPDAVTVQLLSPDDLSVAQYRLLEGYLALDAGGQSGTLEAFLVNADGKELFIRAHWMCDR